MCPLLAFPCSRCGRLGREHALRSVLHRSLAVLLDYGTWFGFSKYGCEPYRGSVQGVMQGISDALVFPLIVRT